MAERYESFKVTEIDADTGLMLGHSLSGKSREFALVVDRDLSTNKLTLGVARHFSDPTSDANFVGSEPWQDYETQGDRE